jgi:hypothetical protein
MFLLPFCIPLPSRSRNSTRTQPQALAPQTTLPRL